MNITTAQLHGIRRLISKEDRKGIAEMLSMSERTVEAVLNGDRANESIEREVLKIVKHNIAHIERVISAIDLQNTLPISTIELSEARNSPTWVNNEYYPRYNDIYFRLCANTWDIDELYNVIKQSYKDLLLHGVYCCDILCRILGVTDEISISYYNDHLK